MERSDSDFNLAIEPASSADQGAACERRERVIRASRAKYGTPRSDIERAFAVEVTPEPEAKEAAPEQEPVSKPAEPVKASPVEPPKVEVPVATAPEVPREKASPPSTDLGRGGAQHKTIQDRIKDEAEKLGFRVTVEKEVVGGAGQIDLVLSRGDMSIACEVTVTSTIDYEVGNVSKCIKAGFRNVAVVGVSEEKLAKLSAAISNSLGPEAAQSTSFHMPDAFIAALRNMPETKAAQPEPVTRTRGGRVVRRKVVVLSPEEAKAKEEEALRIMAQMMKQKTRRE